MRVRGGIIAAHRPRQMSALSISLPIGALAFTLACAATTPQNPPGSAPAPRVSSTIAGKTAGMERHDGFIPLYLDDSQGKIYIELPKDSARALMFVSLATGLGSNPIGLDR